MSALQSVQPAPRLGSRLLSVTRSVAPLPYSDDFTARFTVWRQGPESLCPTGDEIACNLRVHLWCFYQKFCADNGIVCGSTIRSSPWTVRPLPRQGGSQFPRAIEVDVSCRLSRFCGTEPQDAEDKQTRGEAFLDDLMAWAEPIHNHVDFQVTLFKRCLIGYSLCYPAQPTPTDIPVKRLHIQPFHLPEKAKYKQWEEQIFRTRWCHGGLLALHETSEVLLANDRLIQRIPEGYFQNSYVKIGIASLKAASRVLPNLRDQIFDAETRELLDRSSVHDLIHGSYPPVVRLMEDALKALEDLAIATRTRDPTPQQSCNAIHKIYQLKRRTPQLTYVLKFLEDKKIQDKYKWGAIALGGVVIAGSTIIAVAFLPVAAPAAAIAAGSAATGSTVAASGAAAVATSTSIIEGAAVALGGIGGGMIGGGTVLTITSLIEQAESSRMVCLNDDIDTSIELVVYYIALCFMKSNGIATPQDEEHNLKGIMEKLYGSRPKMSQQSYRAYYLHRLVRLLESQFRKLTAGLRKLGYTRLEDIDWTARREIAEGECTLEEF